MGKYPGHKGCAKAPGGWQTARRLPAMQCRATASRKPVCGWHPMAWKEQNRPRVFFPRPPLCLVRHLLADMLNSFVALWLYVCCCVLVSENKSAGRRLEINHQDTSRREGNRLLAYIVEIITGAILHACLQGMNSRLHRDAPVNIGITAVRQPGRPQHLMKELLPVHFQLNHQIGTPARAYLGSAFALVCRHFCYLFRRTFAALADMLAGVPEAQFDQGFIRWQVSVFRKSREITNHPHKQGIKQPLADIL